MALASKEYAIALFGLAAECGLEEEISKGLSFVREVFDETPGLDSFLRSPGISKAVRLQTLRDAFEKEVPEYVMSFLCILCENGEVEMLAECIDEYEKLYFESKNVAYAAATSAVPLTDAEKVSLREKLEKKTGKKVVIEYTLDSELLGGVVIEMDGMTIDGSLRRRLQTMKEVIGQ